MSNNLKEQFYEISLNHESFKYEDNHSIKTNFISLFKWLKRLFSINKIIVDYIKHLENQNNKETIITEVYDNFANNKLKINIDNSINIGNKKIQSINDKIFYIDKLSNNKFVITREEENWITDNLIIQCKIGQNNVNNDKFGTIIYPLIQTLNNQIIIEFTDPDFNNNIDVLIF